MAFKYDVPLAQQTPTTDSKVVLTKSFKIDIVAGSGFTTATAYDLGWLPKDAQVIGTSYAVTTAVSGGTVSAATIAFSVNGNLVASGQNVFATGTGVTGPGVPYMTNLASTANDQKITYTPTLTGAGATAGVIYITLQYVV